jgi:hypothetical protein
MLETRLRKDDSTYVQAACPEEPLDLTTRDLFNDIIKFL